MASRAVPRVHADPWVILRTVPRVHADHRERDLSFELDDPPHLSFLTVSTRVCPARPPPPRILSADLSASLFLTVTPTPHPPAASSSSAAAEAADSCYLVLDAAACTSHRVPDPVPALSASFGVIAAPDGGSFMVVGLGSLIGQHDDRALVSLVSLHCFSSRTGRWATKRVNNPLPFPRRTCTLSNVIAHDGKLWWVDASTSATKGLLYCDPFADEPVMAFVPFPNDVTAVEAAAEGVAYDYVQVSDGRLRWAHVLCDIDEEATDEAPVLDGAPLLSIYTLLGGDVGGYRLDFELRADWRYRYSFCFIWESSSFKATEMPKHEHPKLALIDPNDTDLLYFFLGDYLFGFNIRHSHKVVQGCAPHGMADRHVSSSSLLAWKLPPALVAAPGLASKKAPNNDTGGANLKEESSAAGQPAGPA